MLPEQYHNDFQVIFHFVLEKAVKLLDSDKPKIGRNIIEFLCPLIQSMKKQQNLDDIMRNVFQHVLAIVIKRAKYPGWVTFDEIFEQESEAEYIQYRHELATLLTNLG